MTTGTPFRDQDCAVGGCLCRHWEDWQIALRDHAWSHPRGKEIEATVTDDTEASEAIDDLMTELEGEFPYHAPSCARADCPRHVGD